MIERMAFGSTGHMSSRTLFGAAALGGMKQERADRVLELLPQYGVNHIDTAASYGDSELRLAPFLKIHRKDFFLATKTGERTYHKARDELRRSLERLGVDRVDLIQMHNLVDETGWQTAMGPGGALEALIEAKEEGLVRFIGVTGHGTQVAAMHVRSLEKYPFASVLAPYNYSMMAQPEYAKDFYAMEKVCQSRGVAIQTIKAIARRRWQEGDDAKRFSWYMPLRANGPLERGVHYTLARPGLFLNTSSDATLLPTVLEAASKPIVAPTDAQMAQDQRDEGIEPLFVRGVSDVI